MKGSDMEFVMGALAGGAVVWFAKDKIKALFNRRDTSHDGDTGPV